MQKGSTVIPERPCIHRYAADSVLHNINDPECQWCTEGGGGVQTPSEIQTFWQSWAEFPPGSVEKIRNNLIRIRVSLICKLSGTPWLGDYRPQITFLSALCPQLNLLKPPPETISSGSPLPGRIRDVTLHPEKNSLVRHCRIQHMGSEIPKF
jgi:hypothetical protein